MSEVVTIVLRSPIDAALDVDGLTADRCARLSEREIAELPVWQGNRSATIGDFFDVSGERSSRVRLEGDLALVEGIAAGTAGGELTIDGNAGRRVAAGMTSGRVDVRGNVGDDAGAAMAGGVLCVSGSAGDRLGGALPGAAKGMTGGEIVITGSAGRGADWSSSAATRVRTRRAR